MKRGSFLLLWLLSARAAATVLSPSTCFESWPGSVDRSDVAIKIARQPWVSHDLVSILGEILLRELLGYTVVPMLWDNYSWCYEQIAAGSFDVDFECWATGRGSENYKTYVLDTGQVIDGGITGYTGRSGLYTLRSTLAQRELADYYKFYQNTSEATRTGTPAFADSTLREALGDSFPVCGPEDHCLDGSLEGYYATPGCRDRPESCIEVYMWYSTTDRGFWEQLVHQSGIEAVFGYYGPAMIPHLKSLVNSSTFPVFYWWTPDALHSELDMVRISFPDYYLGCNAANDGDVEDGHVRCDYADTVLWKPLGHGLREKAPEALYFLTKFFIVPAQINAMLGETLTHGSSYEALARIACDFIATNQEFIQNSAPGCITNPPDPLQDGDLVFNSDTLQCESTQVFYSIPSTRCFDPIPGTADRRDRTIRLARRDWATHDVVSMLTEVVLREYLGFEVELVLSNKTEQLLSAEEMMSEYYDLDMEVWLPNHWQVNPQAYSPHLDPLVSGTVLQLGVTGYYGRAGLYIPRRALAKYSMLDYYKVYANSTLLSDLGLRTKAESTLAQVLQADFPVCNSSTSWCGTGSLEGYWAPPQCVDDPGRCIELVHIAPHQRPGYAEQLIANFKLDMVVGYYEEHGVHEVVRSQLTAERVSPFFWWEPDALLLEADAVRISFPDYFFGCAEGDTGTPLGTVECDFPQISLMKLARATLRDFAPEAWYALERFILSKDEMDAILSDAQPLADSVCSWVHANPETMQLFAPSCLATPLPPEDVRSGDVVFSPQLVQCQAMSCPVNTVLRYASLANTFYCDECADGTVPVDNACEKCPAGQQVEGNTGRCIDCEPGRFKAAEGSECENCQVGRFTQEKGRSACDVCNTSSFQDETGALDCKLCEDELVGSVAPLLGATSALLCHCRQGTYLPIDSAMCVACPDGMNCPEGSAQAHFPTSLQTSEGLPYPELKEGFMSRARAPLVVYRCLIRKHCPGGAPGSCATLRDSEEVACGLCAKDAYPTSEDCQRCGGLDVLPIFVLVGVGLLFLGGLVTFVNCNILMKSSSTLTGVIVGGIGLTTLQTLSVLQQLGIDWFEPLETAFGFIAVLGFNLEVVRSACVMGHSVVRQYILRQLVAPGCMFIILLLLVVKKRLKPNMFLWVEFINSAGTIINVFFISIVITSAAPLVCYEHPENGTRSVVHQPSVLCDFTADHASLVAVGIMAWLAVPVPFMMLVLVGVLRYPKYVQSTLTSRWFLLAFRFMFVRFDPAAYWFGLVVVARGLLCCLVPVVIHKPALQVVVMAGIIASYIMILQHTRPWRLRVANMVDSGSGMLFLLILLCIAVMTDIPGTGGVPEVAVGGLIMCFLIPLMLLVYTFVKRRFQDKFGFFICHHKADACAQARLLKMLLVARTGKKVFIDSDDLVELDKLFDTVKSKVQYLLVYLTSDTLKRPWCVGEITTAVSCRQKVVAIRTPSWTQPKSEEAAVLAQQVDTNNLQEQGIPEQDIVHALTTLVGASTPSVTLHTVLGGSNKFVDVAERIADKRWDAPDEHPISMKFARAMTTTGAVTVCADKWDDEAVAASAILVKKIEMEVQGFAHAGVTNLMDVPEESEAAGSALRQIESSRACVMMLSRASLDRFHQVHLIVGGMTCRNTMMIPVSLWDFKFPGSSYFDGELVEMWPDQLGTPLAEAQHQLKAFFNLITVFVDTMAANHILDTQAKLVIDRVPRSYDSRAKQSVHSVHEGTSRSGTRMGTGSKKDEEVSICSERDSESAGSSPLRSVVEAAEIDPEYDPDEEMFSFPC